MWRVEVWVASHGPEVHIAFWIGAFWAAVGLYRGHHELRFVCGLGLGAFLAHLGWGLLHLPASLNDAAWWFEPGASTVLFVPLGMLISAPWREALAPLPLALAIARMGCIPYDCCYAPGSLAAVEIAALLLLHWVVRRKPESTLLLVCAGPGVIRLLLEPLRVANPPLAVAPSAVAALCVALGIALSRRLESCEPLSR